MLRHGSLDTTEQMVEYNYEPVPGDQVTMLTIYKIENDQWHGPR